MRCGVWYLYVCYVYKREKLVWVWIVSFRMFGLRWISLEWYTMDCVSLESSEVQIERTRGVTNLIILIQNWTFTLKIDSFHSLLPPLESLRPWIPLLKGPCNNALVEFESYFGGKDGVELSREWEKIGILDPKSPHFLLLFISKQVHWVW